MWYSLSRLAYKELPRRTAPDKLFCDKTFNIAKNLKYVRNQWGLGSMFYKFFNKKSSGGAITSEIMSNQ